MKANLVSWRDPKTCDSVLCTSLRRFARRRRHLIRINHCPRCGFTLVELLVVVAILLVLVVMTVSAIDFTFSSEKVKSAARQVQSALEGARGRAMFAKEPRGLRLLVDQDDPRIVTGFIYVGAAMNWSEGQISLERPDFPPNGVADSNFVTIIRGNPATAWYTLKKRGYMGLFEDLNLNGVLDPGEDQNGNGLLDLDAPRIKIPAGENGSWYTVLTYRLTSPTNQILELTTPYRDPATTPASLVTAFQSGGPKSYLLELPPRILPDSQPILLPEGVCIDLDGSKVPAAWRPPTAALQSAPYIGRMDVMFSPRGTVTGSIAASGLINFYLTERKDVLRTVNFGVVVGGTATPRSPVNSNYPDTLPPPVPGQNQFDSDNQIGQRLGVTLFTQTGKISTHEINATDSDANGYADNPFQYATSGGATSQ